LLTWPLLVRLLIVGGCVTNFYRHILWLNTQGATICRIPNYASNSYSAHYQLLLHVSDAIPKETPNKSLVYTVSMHISLKLIALLLAIFSSVTFADEVMLETIDITASRLIAIPLGASVPNEASLSSQRSTESDSTRLLQDIPGINIYSAGGVSSLPVVHGMADDQVNVQVNGMGLMPACPNHMNSALSYIDPSNVGSVTVYAGITPVSVGGDSIGGTIQVNSAMPEFANAGDTNLFKGHTDVFYRSNGSANGENASAMIASDTLNMTYSYARVQSDNYSAGGNFKTAGSGSGNGDWLAGNVVGSSSYTSVNQDVGFSLRHDNHLLQLNVSEQYIPFEGFPNQRMDMTSNSNTLINLRYKGMFEWGDLEARIYSQSTQHEMNMGADRFNYGTLGMPMDTNGKTLGSSVKASIDISENEILRIGAESQNYTLYDWWPQAGGMMGPNSFWNIDYGQRNKFDVYAEWEKHWNQKWVSQLGVRSDTVKSNAAPVQGYDNSAMWAPDAVAFNALDHHRTDSNWDFTALSRYDQDAMQSFEGGYARKSRSPNLYQRYPWSTQPMATIMNNFAGDGNGYIGNVDLKPEVANTLSGTSGSHDSNKESWELKTTGYYTYIQDYIDVQRCNFGQCGGIANAVATTGFVNLQYVNQSAQIYGLDISGYSILVKNSGYGSFKATGVLNYVRGKNLTTGDNLYNIMPLNTKLAAVQNLGKWSNTAEVQWVDSKTQVSQVRDEIQTGSYSLFNLRSSYEWKQAKLDIGIENVFNKFYSLPLGGAYVGQGASMGINNIPWGIVVPGMGRSINTSLNVTF